MNTIHDVIIIGSRISSRLTALYLKKEQPDLDIHIIEDPQSGKLPVVGESLTEFSTQLLHELGLSEYLENEHYHKYGLTFYFKEAIDRPQCKNYAVHEALATPPLPSNQLNRFTFDEQLVERCHASGIAHIQGRATSWKQKECGQHVVEVAGEGKGVYSSRWLIDASGRQRFLTKRLQLQKEVYAQRSTSWFRLVNFDRSKLFELNAYKPKQQAFDSYFVTHHFMGKGNWIWLIPMRTSEYDNMISIGVVWRPDLRDINIRTMQEFVEIVREEHPVVAELVESGEVLDFERYRNYLYECKQLYSKAGWYIVGDAGDSVDPLYSTGLVMTSLQIKQINGLIERERAGKLTTECIQEFENVYKSTRDAVQREIADYYEVMHEPYQSHLRMHLISTQYFFFLLPVWLNGYMTDRLGVRFIQHVLDSGKEAYALLLSLLPEVYLRKKGNVAVHDIKNLYDKSVNWNLWAAHEEELPGYFATLAKRFFVFRLTLLLKARGSGLLSHLRYLLQDVLLFVFWKCVGNRKVRSMLLFKKVFLKNMDREEKVLRECVVETKGEPMEKAA